MKGQAAVEREVVQLVQRGLGIVSQCTVADDPQDPLIAVGAEQVLRRRTLASSSRGLYYEALSTRKAQGVQIPLLDFDNAQITGVETEGLFQQDLLLRALTAVESTRPQEWEAQDSLPILPLGTTTLPRRSLRAP